MAVYDTNGEEHGRSNDGFKWALDIEGAVDMTESMTLRQVSQQFGKSFPSTFLLPIESALTVSQIVLKK